MSDPAHTPSATPILSAYATDPDMVELIQLFVEEIPERMKTIQDFWQRRELDELKRIAHQIKGASGGYGFPTLGAAAGVLEQQLTSSRTPDLASIARQVDELVNLCARVRVS
jgi:HPt (histidine-containing phosphotransfer) domain-containing protein